MADWFVHLDGQQQGPFEKEIVDEKLKDRDLRQVLVWQAGYKNWKLASDVPEFAVQSELTGPRPPEPLGIQEKPRKPRTLRWARNGALWGCGCGLLFCALTNKLTFGIPFIIGAMSPFAVCFAIVGALIAGPNRNASDSTFEAPKLDIETALARRNVVIRHWQGDMPLWASYWIVLVVINIVFGVSTTFIARHFFGGEDYYPAPAFFSLCFLWSFALSLFIWQAIGIWRSANKYIMRHEASKKIGVWGYVAKTMMLFVTIGTVGAFVKEGFPQLKETARIAFQDDPSIPRYAIRVMRDGTEAEIAGGIRFGLANDFNTILAASPRITVLHLDSFGGRLSEGKKLFDIIRTRGLNTYISSKCYSACTLAFAGGRERYLKKNAELGFHRGSFPGVKESTSNSDEIQRGVFKAAGFDSDFVTKALATSSSDLWKPASADLIKAHVITSIVDGTKFAVSGMGSTTLTRQEIESKIAASAPVFGSIRAKYPAEFEKMVGIWHESLLKGMTETEAIAGTRGIMVPLIRKLTALADDDVLLDYAKILVDQYQELGGKNPTSCFVYASGYSENTNFVDEMSAATRERELAVENRIVQTAQARPPVKEDLVGEIWARVIEKLNSQGFEKNDWAALTSPKDIPKEQHSRYCSLITKFFRAIVDMPRPEAILLLRDIIGRWSAKAT
jgi:hypothetical protein